MKNPRLVAVGCVVAAVAVPPVALAAGGETRTPDTGILRAGSMGRSLPAVDAVLDESQSEEDRLYQEGTTALDDRQWDRAIQAFRRVTSLKRSRADAAMYWTAWALNKQGNRAEALSALDQLKRGFPKSQWIDEARALETEIRQASGQPVKPESEPDEDLKLIALNSLMNSDSDRAIPMLDKFLQGTESTALKERALFVLAQSDVTQARSIIADVARGSRNPDLQKKALEYLGIFGGVENRRALLSIYESTTNLDIKRQILHSFMVAGERDRLLAVARTEQNAELKKEAIRQLGVMGEGEALWELYQKESSVASKKEIIHALFVGGDADRLVELTQTEGDPEIRTAAIHNLALTGSDRAGAALVSLYDADRSPAVRKAIINGLFIQDSAKALVDLARKETDVQMKKEIVEKLSLMDSKEATDYLMELLVKP